MAVIQGMAVCDLVVSCEALALAERAGLGLRLPSGQQD